MSPVKRWAQVVLTLPSSHQDLLIGQLSLLGFEGFQQEDNWIAAFVPSTLWEPLLQRRLRTVIARFEKEFPDLTISIRTKRIQDQNWNARWERSTGIVEATSSIIIKPSWAKLRKKDKGKIVIHVDPKMSFGTGHHATTRLCLQLLQEYVRPGMKVLDFGTGTGILAIASLKLGATHAVAIDNDPWCIENARENIKRNKMTRKIRLLQTHRPQGALLRFDLISANIDLPTITRFMPFLLTHLRGKGILLISGLLQSDLPALMNLIRKKGIVPVNLLAEDEWAALAIVKLYARSGN